MAEETVNNKHDCLLDSNEDKLKKITCDINFYQSCRTFFWQKLKIADVGSDWVYSLT